ncbi:tRNA-dihydrouridine(47) synthase [NAD(P)(+)]-like [Portunus trituberculatus]|uniref:tRNA-dihydrouridine(47) synthase [NAD(P)(+)]-like n=1 Tax=Portunus trituberculatus TaxID=210409 RepID=UPI001E1D12F1|nr:tRNA-dihydrouridine(47) synthase [NAD(P)(+)]-like [Portunus trituberculatus]XP_045110947.1 tRNA-dihydrouridine(47) synthase [NAD(P)(+)]-like [Portunus trituberculatus]
MHDISAFLSTKPSDLGPECHNFRTYGRCHYGLVCRFGGDHIEGERNKVEQRPNGVTGPATTNTLKKEVQHLLRKRQYDFTKAKEANRKAQSDIAKNADKAKNPEKNTVTGTPTTDTKADTSVPPSTNDSKSQDQSLDPDKNTDTKANTSVPPSTNDSKSQDQSLDADKNTESTPQSAPEDIITSVENGQEKCDTEAVIKNGEKTACEGNGETHHLGPASDEDLVKPTAGERRKKTIDWRGKTYLAPLTTLGNLPFRRICKKYGADITCGEMALAANLLQGFPSEWALVKRHASEDCFGIQLCGSNAETMAKCAQLLDENADFDFMDINMGCPIDLIYKQGGGSALMRRQGCLEQMVRGMKQVLSRPLTLKMRTAVYRDTKVAHDLVQRAKLWDVSMVTIHGRSKEQRYLKLADWDYVGQCAVAAQPMPVFGNGDVLSYEDYNACLNNTGVAGIMIARGALIKPWVFQEIKEQRHWDISSSERLDMLRDFTNFGLEHWGSDNEGVEKTRRFLLEWLSFLHRYVPVGLLESTQKINQQPPAFRGRDDLETLMASRSVNDWIKISEMLLGSVPADFAFLPKHKANAY